MCLKKRIFILLIICLVLFVFITEPVRVDAAAISLVGSKALLMFLLGALGVTVASQTDLEGLIEQMDWDSMIIRNPINLDNYTKLPDEPPDYDKLLKAIIVGGTGLAIGLSGLLVDIKEWFQGLGAEEGENIIGDGSIIEQNYSSSFNILNLEKNKNIVIVNGENVVIVRWEGTVQNEQGKLTVTFPNGETITKIHSDSSYPWWTKDTYNLAWNTAWPNRVAVSDGGGLTVEWTIPSTYTPIPIPNEDGIIYNVKPNSSVLTDIPPTTIPQPDIGTLPGIQEVITPEGEKKYIYPGTMDDLVTDISNNTTFEDLFNSINNYQDGFTSPYTITETQDGLEINYNNITGAPYPDINQDPITDPSEFQGKNISLLMGIINWLKLIWESIMSIPQWLTDLFVLPEDYWGNNFNTIQTKLATKFDQEGSINFIDSLKSIAPKPIPDLYYKGNVILSAGFVNNMASTIKSWLRFLLWVAMVLFGMNSAYKLIRGGNAIERGWYNDSKGSN